MISKKFYTEIIDEILEKNGLCAHYIMITMNLSDIEVTKRTSLQSGMMIE